MRTTEGQPNRRALLGLGAGAALAAAAAGGGPARAVSGRPPHGEDVARAPADLEHRHGARLGVFARNTVTGAQVRHRAQERFPICSVHKIVTVAAVLRDPDRDGTFLARRIHCTGRDVAGAGYAPVTGTPEHLAAGMTIAELCAAALDHSDNAADDLLLRELGGPAAVTRFCRSVGDGVTRLDRWEPAVNSAEPERATDTTSPAAIARTLTDLVLGTALSPPDRRQLTAWLGANTTGAARLRAGLPAPWTLADKTGTGAYGTTNDVGIAWTTDGIPLVLSVLSTQADADAPADEPLIARAAALLVPALG